MDAARKQVEALQLRMAGASYYTIAGQLGYANKGSAHKAVMAGLARWGQEPATELRRVEAARLDELTFRLWDRIRQGDLKAAEVYLRVADRRARMFGLDAPTQVRMEGHVTVSDDVDREIARLVSQHRLAALAPGGEVPAALEAAGTVEPDPARG